MSSLGKLATIDIGTNSVLLTIVETSTEGLETLSEAATITRIGEGLGQQRQFLPAAMERTTLLLQEYVAQCEAFGVDKVIAVGTAAFRRALNAKEYIQSVKDTIGLEIEIISGEREAELSYLAASRDFGEDLLVLDIGGGSTEFIWQGGGISLPIGSVVLHERYVHSDPIRDDDFFHVQNFIMTELLTLQSGQWGGGRGAIQGDLPAKLVALAGTATTLTAMHLRLEEYSHDQVHGTELKLSDVSALLDQIRERTVEERKAMPGLEAKRADVVLEGALLLQETMRLFDYQTVTISDRGVRWGLIYESLAR